MSATKPTKAELEAIAKRFADPAFRDAYNTLRVARTADFLADPDKWLAHAKGGPVSVVDEKGRTVLVLSVPREEKATREAALEAALRELVESLPRCFFRGVVEGGHCTELAVYGVNSHTPEACEKHRYHEYRRNRECDWADAAREAAKLLREEG